MRKSKRRLDASQIKNSVTESRGFNATERALELMVPVVHKVLKIALKGFRRVCNLELHHATEKKN